MAASLRSSMDSTPLRGNKPSHILSKLLNHEHLVLVLILDSILHLAQVASWEEDKVVKTVVICCGVTSHIVTSSEFIVVVVLDTSGRENPLQTKDDPLDLGLFLHL